MTSSAFTDEEFCAVAREEISVALLNYKTVLQIKVSVLCKRVFLSVRFRPEEGLTVETSVLKTLCGGQFTFINSVVNS